MPLDSRNETAETRRFESEWRARFDRFAARGGSDATISGWSEHGLRRRLEIILREVSPPPHPGASRLLDLGCGSGVYCRELAERGWRSVGADYSTGMLTRAKSTVEGSSVPLCAADSFHLPFRDGAFVALINVGVMQHLEDHRAVLSEMARCLEPGGTAYIDTLNKRSIQALVVSIVGRLKSWIMGRWKAPRHAIRRSVDGIARAASDVGLELVGVRCVHILPRGLRWLERPLERLDALFGSKDRRPPALLFANTMLLSLRRK